MLGAAGAALWAAAVWGQTPPQPKITELKLRVEPAGARVRPFETAVVQVLVYGAIGERQGRLESQNWQVQVREDGGGWLSKPFKFQGQDPGGAFLSQQNNALLNLLSRGVGQFTVKDSVLYTAPERPGKYTIEAVSGSIRAEAAIEVSPEAPSPRKPEQTNFPGEPRNGDPYRALAERYAPFIAQETWFQPKADALARFDYDGDWNGDNNWDHLEEGSSQAYVYYAAIETATHWFLIYNFFHPRDYSDNCVAGTCHENDNEGMILTVRKDGSEFGKLEVMETLAHDNVYSHTNEPAIRNGVHDMDGRIDLWEGSHPMIFIEAGGHGVHAAGDPRSFFSAEKMDFTQHTGITYVYKGEAERPKHARDRLVGYDLLPILDHWWRKSELGPEWKEHTFDDFFVYEPFGGRPRTPNGRLGGAFYGRKQAENKAKPFWGWHDIRTLRGKVLARGQWGLDPAYAVSRNLRFPADRPFSLDYTYNPYLGILPAPAVSAAPAAPPRARVAAASVTAAAPQEGTCELSVQVDGTVVAAITGDQAEYQVISGQPARDTLLTCSAPLPFAAAQIRVDKRRGRGAVQLLEEPGAGNGFTAKIRLEDPKGGSDRYELMVRWRR